ncbi:MAG TPA: hypothetical protein VHV78_13095 [Gemmatimonadaceae bacterium]|jgi:hypothetical protein|nr:hypothetical protein [Gemmatimonadaceae bacterium]
MGLSPAGPRFPCSRVLLARTRLAYIHLHNLLTDAKRDRAARISGYVAISLPDELVMLYLLGGEVVNATVRDARGWRPVSIASALAAVPAEAEYGEICFHEADEEQLDCMFATQSVSPNTWPDRVAATDPGALFPFLMSTTFDGVVEIVASDCVNYLVFNNGSVARAFLAVPHPGTVIERVSKLFAKEGRVGELRVSHWDLPEPLAIQAPPALVQAYRDLSSALIDRLVKHGRSSAPAIAEHARVSLVPAHGVLEAFSFNGRTAVDPLADTEALTSGVAAWIREVMWAAADHDSVSPEELLRELTWDRRHMFQSAGLYDQIPWKVV